MLRWKGEVVWVCGACVCGSVCGSGNGLIFSGEGGGRDRRFG